VWHPAGGHERDLRALLRNGAIEGIWLGPSISSGVAEKHGGRIVMRSLPLLEGLGVQSSIGLRHIFGFLPCFLRFIYYPAAFSTVEYQDEQ